MKRQVIYYKENGEVDKFATYINNHDWVIPVVVVVSVICNKRKDGKLW